MKKVCVVAMVMCCAISVLHAQPYQPTPQNIAARQQFQDMKFGMFIHWGLSSSLGAGEWVMNNRSITKKNYTRLLQVFNPVHFDAAKWVAAAKSAGMKYIVFITRHHDGFSNWDTKYSDWKITNTPYGKDVLRMLADECKRQGIKLGLYYSLVDWYRDDYPYETGRTGKASGRTEKSNYASYLQFMKNQLTELLTNYGDIMSIWFDGHWDQTNVEGSADMSSRINWKYDELYSLIHQLQPQCLIGNNHHLAPMPGEDSQMFEKDLPGQNKSGLSYQSASVEMPLETCETMNGSWGFNITDNNYKSVKQSVHYIVNAAGLNTNFLLNIGPMPDGSIQPEFTDTLQAIGKWMQEYGETIFGTRGNVISPQDWGVVTKKNNNLYVHILTSPETNTIFLPGLKENILSAVVYKSKTKIRFKQQAEGVFIFLDGITMDNTDTIIQLTVK
ncbi:MAG: alpha-L-fucosidase [Chitinophagaceae bacterium]|nr:MAG: alpha-L-fucosidase [Chitinophagaceae bacterium]